MRVDPSHGTPIPPPSSKRDISLPPLDRIDVREGSKGPFRAISLSHLTGLEKETPAYDRLREILMAGDPQRRVALLEDFAGRLAAAVTSGSYPDTEQQEDGTRVLWKISGLGSVGMMPKPLTQHIDDIFEEVVQLHRKVEEKILTGGSIDQKGSGFFLRSGEVSFVRNFHMSQVLLGTHPLTGEDRYGYRAIVQAPSSPLGHTHLPLGVKVFDSPGEARAAHLDDGRWRDLLEAHYKRLLLMGLKLPPLEIALQSLERDSSYGLLTSNPFKNREITDVLSEAAFTALVDSAFAKREELSTILKEHPASLLTIVEAKEGIFLPREEGNLVDQIGEALASRAVADEMIRASTIRPVIYRDADLVKTAFQVALLRTIAILPYTTDATSKRAGEAAESITRFLRSDGNRQGAIARALRESKGRRTEKPLLTEAGPEIFECSLAYFDAISSALLSDVRARLVF